MFNKTCKECGTEFQAKKVEAKFCCQQCRLTFNNRRRDRGAILYDILMNCRYDREKALKVFGTNNVAKIMSEMATGWKAQDDQSNQRPSKTWQSASAAREAIGTTRSINFV